MEVTHFSSSDKRHVVTATSVKNWKCVLCGHEEHSFDPGAPFCPLCQKYMVLDTTITESKVKEIKNRTVKNIGTLDEEHEKSKKGRAGRYDDDIISKQMKAVVRPRKGDTIPLLLEINMDKSAFMKGMVYLHWGSYTVMTSVNEIGKAFTPFDPTPQIAIKETSSGPEEVTLGREIHRGKSKIGDIIVEGGITPHHFKEGLVNFKIPGQKSTFSMIDIAMILHYAI